MDDLKYISKWDLIEARKLSFPPSFVTSIPATLTQKGRRSAAEVAEDFRGNLLDTQTLFGMRFLPRAAVGLELAIQAAKGRPPRLEALAKFYVDLFKGTLIADDRQIHYLTVYPPRPKGHGLAEGNVFVRFDRLERLRRRFDLCWRNRNAIEPSEKTNDLDDFDSAPPSTRRLDFLETQLNNRLASFEFECELRKEMMADNAEDAKYFKDDPRFIPIPASTPEYEYSRRVFLQLSVIEEMNIYWFERPLSWSPRNDLERNLCRLRQPFTLEIPGELSQHSQGGSLRSATAEACERLRERLPLLVPIKVPIALDVQVWTQHSLSRDLDNILGSLLPVFRERLLGEGGQVNGIRIYVNRSSGVSPPPSIRAKIVDPWSIHRWEDRVQSVLEKLRDLEV